MIQDNKIGKNIGIDLGTTQSSVAFHHVKTVNLQNAEGQQLTPSVVSWNKTKKTFLVGQAALDWMNQNPALTVRSVKRLLGRSFDDPSVQKIIQENRVTYKIQRYSQAGGGHGEERSLLAVRTGEQNLSILLNGMEFLPEDLSAEILKKLKEDAELALGAPVASAVVTVPAFFNDKQKNATRVAANKAGIQLLRLLPEPTAAALSFGLELSAQTEGHQILVFDFGGGTLDLCLLTVAGGQYLEIGKGGDSWLGGDDIDQALIDHIYKISEVRDEFPTGSIEKWVNVLPASEKSRWSYEIKRKSEEAKILLSSQEKVVVDVVGLLKNEEGDLINLEAEVSRQDLEKILTPIVERAIELVKNLLTELHFEPKDVTRVLLVGGSSQIPLIQRKLREFFSDQQVFYHERPLLAIAEGAAILAKNLSLDEKDENHAGFGLVHTTSHDYLLELQNGESSILVEKNTPLPLRVKKSFRLVDRKQNLVHLKFFNPVNNERQLVGNLWLSFDRKELLDETRHQSNDSVSVPELETLEVDFSIDESNIIFISAQLRGAPNVNVSKTMSRGYADETFFMDLEKCIALGNQAGVPFFTAVDVKCRSQFLINQINQVVDQSTHQINQTIVEKVSLGLETTRKILENHTGSYGKIFFAKRVLETFGYMMEPKQKQAFEKTLMKLESATQDGTLEEIEQGKEKLSGQLDKYPIFTCFINLENAHDIAMENDPTRAVKIRNYLGQISHALEEDKPEVATKLLGEIIPEAGEICSGLTRQKFTIHKDIKEDQVS